MASTELLPCPFCAGPAAEPDGNDFTWCPNIACFEGYMHVTTWNSRPVPIECPPAPAPHLEGVAANKAEAILRIVRKMVAAEHEHAQKPLNSEDREGLDFLLGELIDFTTKDVDEALRIVRRRRATAPPQPNVGGDE